MKNVFYKFIGVILAVFLFNCTGNVLIEEKDPSMMENSCKELAYTKYPVDKKQGILAENIDLPSADQEDHYFFTELKQLFPECDQYFIASPEGMDYPIYYGTYEKIGNELKCSFFIQYDAAHHSENCT